MEEFLAEKDLYIEELQSAKKELERIKGEQDKELETYREAQYFDKKVN